MSLRERRRRESMGQKFSLTGFRLGITENWRSRWYARRTTLRLSGNDLAIRKFLAKAS